MPVMSKNSCYLETHTQLFFNKFDICFAIVKKYKGEKEFTTFGQIVILIRVKGRLYIVHYTVSIRSKYFHNTNFKMHEELLRSCPSIIFTVGDYPRI